MILAERLLFDPNRDPSQGQTPGSDTEIEKMNSKVIHSRTQARRAFTLAEVLVSCGIVALLVMANMAAIYQMRVLSAKDAEKGIISGFMQHYIELVKALPFDQVRTNLPISGLYSGNDGTAPIILPSNAEWIDLSGDNYQMFHPALLWVTNRHPQMRVSIQTSTVSGVIHDKHVALEVQWDSPFAASPKLNQKLDLFRVKDL